jgi:hypothetical protein
MDQIGSQRTSTALMALLLMGWSIGAARAQAPNPPAANPTPAATPAPTASTPATPPVPEPPDKVVFKVGDQQFTKAQMDNLIAHLDPRAQGTLAAKGRKPLGDWYAVVVILSQWSLAHHLEERPDFIERLAFQKELLEAQAAADEINRQVNVTPEDIQKYYNDHAASYDEITVRQILVRVKPASTNPAAGTSAKENLRPTVRLGWVGQSDAVVQAELKKNPQVSGLTVQGTEATFKYSGPDGELSGVLSSIISAGVKVSHFDETKAPALPSTPGLSPEEAKARAEAIRKEIMAGTDIKKVMEDFKAPGEVIIEGEPRHVRRQTMRPDMEKLAFAVKDGDVSEPLEIPAGLVMFQVTAHSHVDLKTATPDIERLLRPQKAEEALTAVKKSQPIWMDDQYFGPPTPPPAPAPPTVPAPNANMPPRPAPSQNPK